MEKNNPDILILSCFHAPAWEHIYATTGRGFMFLFSIPDLRITKSLSHNIFVILSAAKNLLFSAEILRYAQDDGRDFRISSKPQSLIPILIHCCHLFDSLCDESAQFRRLKHFSLIAVAQDPPGNFV